MFFLIVFDRKYIFLKTDLLQKTIIHVYNIIGTVYVERLCVF